jgi:predicted ribosome quality control (RQC) complex YloA/Tae2 family protein
MLLKVGRHIRPKPSYKLIVSREEGENKFLKGYRKHFTSIETQSCGGPLTLIDGTATEEDLETASRIVARFSQGKNESCVTVKITHINGDETTMEVPPMPPSEIKQEWYV